MKKFDEVLRRDDVWFQIAVAVAVLVFVALLIGTLIAFLAGDSDAVHVGARVDIVYKLGLIGAGLITFCTVAWRRLLATQQVDAQRKQIDKLSEQIFATAENNLASLLQKGAELISSDKPGHVSAGIATLQAVATDKNPKFATEAMNILADYVQAVYPATNGPLVLAARRALEAASKLSRCSDRHLRFAVKEPVTWEPIFGVAGVTFEGGEIFGKRLGRMLAQGVNVNCRKMKIAGGDIAVETFPYIGCDFSECKILKLEPQLLGENRFYKCDFSDTDIGRPKDLKFDIGAANWFAPGHPPTTTSDQPVPLHIFGRPPKKDEIPF
jgi:hypothetical protein